MSIKWMKRTIVYMGWKYIKEHDLQKLKKQIHSCPEILKYVLEGFGTRCYI